MPSNEGGEVGEDSRAHIDGGGGDQCAEGGGLVDRGQSPLVVVMHVVIVGSLGVANCCHHCQSSPHAAVGALEEGEMETWEGGMLWLVMTRKTTTTPTVLLMEHPSFQ